MRKLLSFMVVTLDGFYEGRNQEFDWPNVDDQFNEFAVSQRTTSTSCCSGG